MLATRNNELIVVRKDDKNNKFYNSDGNIVEIQDLIISDETRLTGFEKEITFYQYLKENNNLCLIEEMIKSIQDYRNNHYCYGKHGFQVNVKHCTDIEEEIPSTMEELSETDITSAVDKYTESVINSFKKYTIGLNTNIVDVGLAGRSNGWLEIATTVSVCEDLDLKEKISQCSEHDIFIETEYKSVELMVLFIHHILPEIQKRKIEFENTLSSDKFWIQAKNAVDISIIQKVRADHSKLPKISNGMEAWITYASWGYGVRFYPVGLGYDGMTEKTSDGTIRLVERL